MTERFRHCCLNAQSQHIPVMELDGGLFRELSVLEQGISVVFEVQRPAIKPVDVAKITGNVGAFRWVFKTWQYGFDFAYLRRCGCARGLVQCAMRQPVQRESHPCGCGRAFWYSHLRERRFKRGGTSTQTQSNHRLCHHLTRHTASISRIGVAQMHG